MRVLKRLDQQRRLVFCRHTYLKNRKREKSYSALVTTYLNMAISRMHIRKTDVCPKRKVHLHGIMKSSHQSWPDKPIWGPLAKMSCGPPLIPITTTTISLYLFIFNSKFNRFIQEHASKPQIINIYVVSSLLKFNMSHKFTLLMQGLYKKPFSFQILTDNLYLLNFVVHMHKDHIHSEPGRSGAREGLTPQGN